MSLEIDKKCPECDSENVEISLTGPSWCKNCGFGTGARFDKEPPPPLGIHITDGVGTTTKVGG